MSISKYQSDEGKVPTGDLGSQAVIYKKKVHKNESLFYQPLTLFPQTTKGQLNSIPKDLGCNGWHPLLDAKKCEISTCPLQERLSSRSLEEKNDGGGSPPLYFPL